MTHVPKRNDTQIIVEIVGKSKRRSERTPQVYCSEDEG